MSVISSLSPLLPLTSILDFFLVAFDHAITFSVFGRWAPLWLHISSRLRLASSSHSQPNCSPSTFFFTHSRMACDANVLLKLLLVGFEATLMTPNSMEKHKATFYGATSPHLSLLTHPFLILPWLLWQQLTIPVFPLPLWTRPASFSVCFHLSCKYWGSWLSPRPAFSPSCCSLLHSCYKIYFLPMVLFSKHQPQPHISNCCSTLPPGCSIQTGMKCE